jgi:hypothetical protein
MLRLLNVVFLMVNVESLAIWNDLFALLYKGFTTIMLSRAHIYWVWRLCLVSEDCVLTLSLTGPAIELTSWNV